MLAAAAVAALPLSASAYELNPLKDRTRGGEMPPSWAKKIETVHEDVTYAAMACANASNAVDQVTPGPLCSPTLLRRDSRHEGNIDNSLIVGLWWNDDPKQLAYANLLLPAAVQYVQMKEAARRARKAGARHHDNRMKSLLYRSHYGDLQFLHGMAGADLEDPFTTQQNIIDWMSFAYHVAIGDIRQDTPLRDIDDPVGGLFRDHPRLTVKALFKPKRTMAHLRLSQLALGSMLHVIQDSFAAGHTQRVHSPSPQCPSGRVAQFYSYLRQASTRHLSHDTRDAFRRSNAVAHAANPVDASARMILLARSRADWTTVVEPYLRGKLFCVQTDALAAGPGEHTTEPLTGRPAKPSRLSAMKKMATDSSMRSSGSMIRAGTALAGGQ